MFFAISKVQMTSDSSITTMGFNIKDKHFIK